MSFERHAHVALLAGMAAGPQAFHQIMEGASSEIHGKAAGGTLELPRPYDERTMELTKTWGFVWPENYTPYQSHMARNLPLCLRVQVPEGWSIVGTDHHMYKNLLDERGQVRASLMVYYQDHDAVMSAVPKYRATVWQANHADNEPCWPVIEDSSSNVVWTGQKIEPDPNYKAAYAAWLETSRAEWDTLASRRAAAPKMPKQGQAAQQTRYDEEDKALRLKLEQQEPQRPCDRARNDARTMLSSLGIDPANQKWFDQPFEFPASPDTLPILQNYSLRTDLYHSPGGSYADGGAETIRAASDQAAIQIATGQMRYNSGYHRKASLSNPVGETIWKHEDPKPQTQYPQNPFGPRGYIHNRGGKSFTSW